MLVAKGLEGTLLAVRNIPIKVSLKTICENNTPVTECRQKNIIVYTETFYSFPN